MLTLEKLRAYGAQVDIGLERCMKNEAFYLRLVQMQLNDPNLPALETALETGNYRAAFEAAHALKGVLGNLALKPLFDPVSTVTDLLRHDERPVDTGDLMLQIRQKYEELKALAG